MAPTTSSQSNAQAASLDKVYLRFFKYAVLALMSLALIAVLVMLPMAAYQYFQTPAPPAPARPAPEKVISIDDLKKFLLDEEKRRKEQEKNGGAPAPKQSVSNASPSSLYAEHAVALQRCADEFRVLAEQATDPSTETQIAERREQQRANIENLANHQFRGANWVNAMVSFTCSVLKNPEIAKLKKESAIGAVFNPTIRFHAHAWATVEKEKADFRQGEENRVARENASEEARVAIAKAKAIALLSIAGSAMLVFLVLALYLIFAKIEENLGLINASLKARPVSTPAHEYGRH